MFDISFGEMLLIGIVALVVIGPEKLPSVARTLGALVGRMQRYVNDVKADIQRETSMSELKQLGAEVTSAAQNLRDSVTRQVDEVQASVESVRQDLTTPVAEAGQPVGVVRVLGLFDVFLVVATVAADGFEHLHHRHVGAASAPAQARVEP